MQSNQYSVIWLMTLVRIVGDTTTAKKNKHNGYLVTTDMLDVCHHRWVCPLYCVRNRKSTVLPRCYLGRTWRELPPWLPQCYHDVTVSHLVSQQASQSVSPSPSVRLWIEHPIITHIRHMRCSMCSSCFVFPSSCFGGQTRHGRPD